MGHPRGRMSRRKNQHAFQEYMLNALITEDILRQMPLPSHPLEQLHSDDTAPPMY